jgi:hypothetical protein
MTHKDPNRLGDRIIFWTCLIATFCLMISSVYDYGVEQGMKKCSPTVLVPKQMSYPKTKKEMAMFLRTREAAGGVR